MLEQGDSVSASRLRVAQAQQLLRTWPTLAGGNILGYAAAYLCRGTSASISLLWAWCVALTFLAVVRTALWLHYRRPELDDFLARRVVVVGFWGACIAGTLWGAGLGYLLAHAQPAQIPLLLLTAMGLSISAVFSYGIHFPTFLAFYLLIVASVVPVLAVQPAVEPRWLAFGMAVFVAAITTVALSFNRMALRSLALRFENLELIAQLTLAKESAELATESKSRFLAAASHDLRQPVHAMGLYLDALAALALSAPAQSLAEKLRQCVVSMDSLFRGLLDVSQLDAGAVAPEFQTFMIATVLDRLQVEFEPQAQAKGLELRLATCCHWVCGDELLVERVLRNLVSNAIRHTRTGKVLLGCRRRGASLRVGVYDTGPGIPLAKQAQVFEEFVQLGNPQRDRNQGVGLGLSIVRRLVTLQRLPLLLQSIPGRGTVFFLDLPMAEQVAFCGPIMRGQEVRRTEGGHSSLHVPPPGEKAVLANRVVVLVDDELSVLDAARIALQTWGCTVVAAASGEEALEVVGNAGLRPDLLLCDHLLGTGLTGIETISALRGAFGQDVPAMLITGDTAPSVLKALHATGLQVLHKPLHSMALYEAVLHAMQSGSRARLAGLGTQIR